MLRESACRLQRGLQSPTQSAASTAAQRGCKVKAESPDCVAKVEGIFITEI